MDSKPKSQISSFDYEVFGKVQGVFFRKYTKEQADSLKLKGWVMNTQAGTVVGTVQGPADKVKQMETWLSTKGSPKSKISKFEKKNEKTIDKSEYSDFSIKK